MPLTKAPDGRQLEPHKPNLKRAEEADAAERSAVRAHVVHEAIRYEGEDELRRPAAALA